MPDSILANQGILFILLSVFYEDEIDAKCFQSLFYSSTSSDGDRRRSHPNQARFCRQLWELCRTEISASRDIATAIARSSEEVERLKVCLQEFVGGYAPVPITLSGFGAFPPGVIYVDVVKTPELMALQSGLAAYLEANVAWVDPRNRSRPFSPHMTVAFRDLKREAFQRAWSEFEDRSLYFEFTASYLTLLSHNGQRWEIETEFPLHL